MLMVILLLHNNHMDDILQAQKKLDSTSEDTHTSACLGADILMKLLTNYCRSEDIRTSITVGVVGEPL